jgi:hypothetical protein
MQDDGSAFLEVGGTNGTPASQLRQAWSTETQVLVTVQFVTSSIIYVEYQKQIFALPRSSECARRNTFPVHPHIRYKVKDTVDGDEYVGYIVKSEPEWQEGKWKICLTINGERNEQGESNQRQIYFDASNLQLSLWNWMRKPFFAQRVSMDDMHEQREQHEKGEQKEHRKQSKEHHSHVTDHVIDQEKALQANVESKEVNGDMVATKEALRKQRLTTLREWNFEPLEPYLTFLAATNLTTFPEVFIPPHFHTTLLRYVESYLYGIMDLDSLKGIVCEWPF